MSTRSVVLVDPKTGEREQTWTGFSWPCLIFCFFWFAYHRLYLEALVALIAAIATSGLAWLGFAFFANGIHTRHLKRRGWVPEDSAVRCPDCRELVRHDARVCKHCRCQLVPQPLVAGGNNQ